MRDRRRGRGLWAAIVDDPYRKLVAVGLAILMWFFINSRITESITRTIPLDVVSQQELSSQGGFDRLAVALPTDRVVANRFLDGETPIDTVTVVLSGPRFRIDALRDEPLNLAVTTFLARDWTRAAGQEAAGVETLDFDAGDIRRDLRALQEVRIELVPTRVRLEIERVENLSVPLSDQVVEIVADQIQSRLRPETARYTPDVATIFGPAVGMEQLKRRAGKPFRVALRATGNERQVTGQLEIIGGEGLGLRLEPTPVLQMELLPQTSTFTLEVPVVVDDVSLPPDLRGRYKAEETTRAVRVQVAGNLRTQLILKSEDPDDTRLQEWALANLRLSVYVPRPESGVIYADEMDRQAWLVPAGPLIGNLDRNECVLENPQVVRLRRKP